MRFGPAPPDIDNRLRFEERQILRERMKRVDVEFVVTRIEIHEGKRCDPIVRPLIEGHENPAILGVVDVVPVGRGKELGSQALHLR